VTLVLAGIFVTIILIILGIYYAIYKRVYGQERTISKRVKEFYKTDTGPKENPVSSVIRDDQRGQLDVLDRFLEKFSVTQKLERLLIQAGSSTKVGQLVMLMVILGIVGFLIGLVTRSIFLIIILLFLFGSLPLLHVHIQRRNRLKAFIRGFPDALDMMTSAIRAGHALNQAIQLVGQEAPDPIGVEFKKTFEQHNLGLNIRETLLNPSERLDSLDLKLFVTAILLQRETGGNLTEILEKISYTIRERFKLIGQIKTYTAQGRMSAWILGTLPVIFVLIISVLNPDYLTPLFQDKIGHYLILTAASLQAVGFVVIRRIVRIKYQ
jgi:tight adherence protein B